MLLVIILVCTPSTYTLKKFSVKQDAVLYQGAASYISGLPYLLIASFSPVLDLISRCFV